jgi:hypothetical protein
MLARLNTTVASNSTFEAWVREPDFLSRFLNGEAFAGSVPSTSSSFREYARPDRSPSMARVSLHQYHESMNPPSLSSAHTNAEDTATESSISTGLASQFTGVPLLDENNGVLQVPLVHSRSPQYQCVFWFLDCNHIFRDQEQWEEHCLSHFRGEEPPLSAQCPLCEWTCNPEPDDGWTAWSTRMEHLATQHLHSGETLKTSRPDFRLYQHLWRKRLIDEQDLKELMGGNHNITQRPSSFVTTNGRNTRRGRDITHRQLQHISRRAPQAAYASLQLP